MNINSYFGSNIEYQEYDDLIIKVNALIIASNLSSGEIYSLDRAYRDGLMESGDTPSKGGRDSLVEKGVLCQTCHISSDYTFSVSYPLGFYVCKALQVPLIRHES